MTAHAPLPRLAVITDDRARELVRAMLGPSAAGDDRRYVNHATTWCTPHEAVALEARGLVVVVRRSAYGDRVIELTDAGREFAASETAQ